MLKHLEGHSEHTLQSQSVRKVVAVAAILGLKVWSANVKLAYLQATGLLQRRIFIENFAPEFELEADQCFELLKPLYDPANSGDLRHKSLDTHHTEDLDMTQKVADPSIYFRF